MKLFPESYKKHVTRLHIIAVAIAAILLLMCVAWMFVVVIVDHDAFPKVIRLFFGRVIVIILPLSIIVITLVIYSINKRFHKSQSEISHKRRLENRLADRADLLKSFEHVNYYYPFRALQTFIPLSIISSAFTVLALIYRTLFPFGIIAIFSILMFGPIWLFYQRKKNDFVHLTPEGLSYRFLSETGLLPWDSIKEFSLTKQGYLIQGEDRRLIIGIEIEPISAPQLSFIKGLLTNNRYAKELIEQIQQLAPHAYYRKSFLQRDIFAKD